MIEFLDIHFITNFICILLITVLLYFVSIRSILKRIITLSLISLILCLLYVLMDSPDVAMTEAAVNAAISTIFLLVIYRKIRVGLNKKIKINDVRIFIQQLIAGIVSLVIFCVWLYFVNLMPDYGSYTLPANSGSAAYYIGNTWNEIGINSIVTAVLASYRGFDTLGETLVIFIAGLIVTTLLTNKSESSK